MSLLKIRKDNLLFGIYIFTVLSDWAGNFLPVPLGSRHIVLLIIPLFALSSFYVERRTLIYFLFLTLISILAYTNLNADFFNFLVGYLFTFLFLIIHMVFYNIKLSDEKIIRLLKLIVHINIILAIPTLIGGLSDFDLRNHAGVFREVGAFATVMMCSQMISLFLYRVTRKHKYFKLAIFFSLICLLTILKKTMFLSILTWIVYAYFYMNWKQWLFNFRVWVFSILVALVMIGPLTANLAKNASYLNAVGAESHVRLGMYIQSIKLSRDFAPFGSGLGTFGSFASIINNPIVEGKFDIKFNKLYYSYGIDGLAGNSEERARDGGMTILDTYWPHILGELGIFGLIGVFWFWMGKIIYLLRKKDPQHEFAYAGAFYVCAVYLSIMGEGLALIQPELPFFIFFHAGISALLLRKINISTHFKKI